MTAGHVVETPSTPLVKKSWIPLVLTLLVTGFTLFLLFLMQSNSVQAPPRTPTRYILPDSFSGSVKVYYGVADSPALREQDGMRIAEIPNTGYLLTSSEPLYGQARDEFVRLTEGGEPVTLGYQYIRDRKNGVTGDNKEYFLRPEELQIRDGELLRHGIVQLPEGTPRYGVAYELFTVRDDF
jgi:hypothetical protein